MDEFDKYVVDAFLTIVHDEEFADTLNSIEPCEEREESETELPEIEKIYEDNGLIITVPMANGEERQYIVTISRV